MHVCYFSGNCIILVVNNITLNKQALGTRCLRSECSLCLLLCFTIIEIVTVLNHSRQPGMS